MPGAELLSAMGKYNEELIKAGVMQGGGGIEADLVGQASAVLRRPALVSTAFSSDRGASRRLLDLGT